MNKDIVEKYKIGYYKEKIEGVEVVFLRLGKVTGFIFEIRGKYYGRDYIKNHDEAYSIAHETIKEIKKHSL